MTQRRFVWFVAPIVAVPFLVMAGPAAAAGETRYVATTGSDVNGADPSDCLDASNPCLTIQHAVDEADAGDAVSVGAGAYAESVRIRMSLTITGAGAGKTTVTGDGGDPGFFVDGFATSVVPNVLFSNLAASGNTASDGFTVIEGVATLNGVAASQNDGSGLYVSGGTVHVQYSSLDENLEFGAELDENQDDDADLNSGELTVTASTVNANQGGGVIVETGTARIEDSTVDANVGAGVVAEGGIVTVTGATIAHTAPFTNGGSAFGGGVAVRPGASATVSESTLYDNTNFGMAVLGGVGRISNSTISHTRVGPAEDFAGGGLVYVPAAQQSRASSALSAVTDAAATPGLTAIATVDADNHEPDCAGPVADRGYNLDSDGSCRLSAKGSRSHAKADLGKLGYHGGPTKTVVPGFSSAARNAIPFGSAGCVKGATDQRGQPRRAPHAGRCDIGSVEAAVVNPTLHWKIVATHRSHHWYRGRVAVKYTCKVGSAPLTHRCPAPTVFHSSGRGHHVTKTLTAVDGGRARVTVRGIKIDNTKPRIKVAGVKSGHTYPKLQGIHPKCRDSLSGIATCRARTHRHGSTVHYTVTARDNAGNVRQRNGKYFTTS